MPRFLLSQSYRYRVAHKLVGRRIDAWERRGQLLADEAAHLRGNLESEESSAYLTDFGVHLAIKPFVKFVNYTHLLATRFQVKEDFDFKTIVTEEALENPEERKTMIKSLKAKLEQR